MHPPARRLLKSAALLSPLVVVALSLGAVQAAAAQEVVTTQRSLSESDLPAAPVYAAPASLADRAPVSHVNTPRRPRIGARGADRAAAAQPDTLQQAQGMVQVQRAAFATVEAPLPAPATARLAKPLTKPATSPLAPPAEGFGMFAMVRAHAVDMASPDHLVNGPSGSLMDEAAGLGWKKNNLSAMVGYMRPDYSAPLYEDESIQYHKPHGRVGVGLSLHY